MPAASIPSSPARGPARRVAPGSESPGMPLYALETSMPPAYTSTATLVPSSAAPLNTRGSRAPRASWFPPAAFADVPSLNAPVPARCRDAPLARRPEAHKLHPAPAPTLEPAQPNPAAFGFVSNLRELHAIEAVESASDDAGALTRPSPQAPAPVPRVFPLAKHLHRDSLWSVMSDESLENAEKPDPLVNPHDIGRLHKTHLAVKIKRHQEHKRYHIELNIVSILQRQQFLLTLARTMIKFGAPAHRIESQLSAAARILELPARFVQVPGLIICAFRDHGTMTTDSHFLLGVGGLALGKLHQVHQIYRKVVHDDISAQEGVELLAPLEAAQPEYGTLTCCVFAFGATVLICLLAFGGSMVDIGVAGLAGFVVAVIQSYAAPSRADYALVFDTASVGVISFIARGLSSIHYQGNQLFCYSALTFASIGGLLPGFIILSAALELGSRTMLSGSTKLVYALVTVMFIGFALNIGSDLYLLFDTSERTRLAGLSAQLVTSVTADGALSAANMSAFPHLPLAGTWTFTNATTPLMADVFQGCYRPAHFPWYLQPFPWWSQFVAVPAFALLASLANMQPLRSRDLPAMVLVACTAWAVKGAANLHMADRPDVVSFVGAFVVAVLANVYSRLFKGTAFTVMITGVMFLVPSGLSVAGGLNAVGNGVDIGETLLQIVVGVTVGVFLGQVVVYLPGRTKTSAAW